MKIGIDCRLWGESGVGRYIRNLVCNLQKIDDKNNYVLFVRKADYENIKYLASRRSGQILNFKWKIAIADIRWHTLNEQLKFPSILNKENLDLMHFPYFSVPIFYNKPFVVTIHDLIIHHFPTGQASTLLPFLYQLKLFGYKYVISHAAKNAQKIITVSNVTKNEITEHLKIDPKKIIVAYEGVDREILNIKHEISSIKNPYFLYVGNAYPHKNLDRLVEAFNILISQYPSVSLVLVGQSDYFYKRLQGKVRKMRLENNIKFLGEVSDLELNQLYKNAMVLVMPSLMEGFGLPAIEAMANKCLVLASDIPSLKETCLEAALYFDPYNIDDIAKKLRDVYFNDSNHHSDLVKKGYERVRRFSWEKMARETLRIYESCFSL